MNRMPCLAMTLATALCSLLPARPVPAGVPGTAAGGTPSTRARGVVLFIGDGMGIGQLSTAAALLAGPGGDLAITRMPVTGLMVTSAANNLVTDSAAAATAMACGVKTDRRVIGLDPSGRRLPNLFEVAHGAGLATGVVTTSGLVDATPAGFTVHAESRYDSGTILREMLASPFDILVGGDFTRYPKAMGKPDYVEALEHAEELVPEGTALVRSMAGLREATGRVVALLPPRDRHPEQHGPLLKRTVGLALERLGSRPGGFLLLVETELTDEAGHANDLDAVLEGVRELDGAVAAALDFARERGDVLVIVTADHDTGGAGILGGPPGGGRADVEWLTHSHTGLWVECFAEGPGAVAFTGLMDNTDLARRIAGALGLALAGGPSR